LVLNNPVTTLRDSHSREFAAADAGVVVGNDDDDEDGRADALQLQQHKCGYMGRNGIVAIL